MDNRYCVTSVQQLLALYGDVNRNSLAKEVRKLTSEYRRWLERSVFFSFASAGPDGLDCAARGDNELQERQRKSLY